MSLVLWRAKAVFLVEPIGARRRLAAAIRYENGMSRRRAPVRGREPHQAERNLSLDVN
jgi:hypothetical protein